MIFRETASRGIAVPGGGLRPSSGRRRSGRKMTDCIFHQFKIQQTDRNTLPNQLLPRVNIPYRLNYITNRPPPLPIRCDVRVINYIYS